MAWKHELDSILGEPAKAYNNLENEKPRHQANFQPSPLWNTLEERK
jgi:hypothetical protein